jgi:ribosomal protein L11 methyltransferase
MICANLMAMDLRDKHVLDCGSGTGILGICALKLGAGSVVAYDIDEWSTDNTRHNAVINGVDDRLASLCGDATLLDSLDQRFDLVLANINRNILLQDMPRFVSVMAPGATLILSGFYESDCALLESKAQQFGLSLQSTKTDGDWACMVFTL